MAAFSDPELIKLSALGCAFIVGVGVCIYVVLRETAELNRRRQAKKLMYEDEVRRELNRKKSLMEQMQASNAADAPPTPVETSDRLQRSSGQSFA